MFTRRRTSLCREGWYLLLLLAAVLTWALLRENNLLLLVSGLICGMLLIDWRMSLATLRRVEVRRRIVSGSHAGSWITVELEVHNNRSRLASWAVAVEDRVAPKTAAPVEPPLRPRLMFPFVPVAQYVRQSYRVWLPHRGRYALGPLRVSTRFPFGLVQRAVWLDCDDELIVLPRLGRLRPAWLRHCPPAAYGARGARRPGYVPGDFFAVREWQAGDSVRWVHWRSTARHRELVVRQFEQPGERQLAVLLDLWTPEDPLPDHPQRIELAISFAATMVADFCRRQGPALLAIAAAQPVCLAARAAGPFSRQAFLSLALAEATPAAPRASLWDEALSRIGPEVELVVISTRQEAAEALPQSSVAARSNLGQRASYRLIVVDAAGSALSEFFQWDPYSAEAKS